VSSFPPWLTVLVCAVACGRSEIYFPSAAADAGTDAGPTCVGAADGTPCALWWAPCVTDATCTNGTCDSPTADAFQPGQVLWQWDGGTPGGYFAIDSVGTSYVLVNQDPQSQGLYGWALTAVDHCGRQLWQVPAEAVSGWGATMLSGGEVVVLSNIDLATYDAASGAQLSRTDLSTYTLAGAVPFTDTGAIAFSNQGALALANGGQNPLEPGVGLLDLSPIGAVNWSRAEGSFGQVVADRSGNLYATVALPSESSVSFDPSGNTRFTFGVTDMPGMVFLAVGADYILTLYNPNFQFYDPVLGAFDLSGNALYQVPFVPGFIAYSSSAVIDASGTAYVCGDFTGTEEQVEVEAINRSGTVLWTAPFPNAACGPMSLGDGDTLYAESIQSDDSLETVIQLALLDTASGSVREGPANLVSATGIATLAVTPSAELIQSGLFDNSGLTALFAGQHQPPAGAPWPRQGGDNTNRNCPSPP
jgi:hypothetical protein